ncbi:MAG: hypothetical protein FWC47_16080 [Oscillospiraceae bacterium]|nr:hypothetical protein [Oscillospiraceae bacterium]
MATISKGNCYLCGAEVDKRAIKNHLLKKHKYEGKGQVCYLIKIEGKYEKDYWLYIDIPVTERLIVLDNFLRFIWLECCGHMSEFSYNDEEIDNDCKLNKFSVGDKFLHEYDFGTTTESIVTIVSETVRKSQIEPIRLLARNIPLKFKCEVCGKDADVICTECGYEIDNPFYCNECFEEHEHPEMSLPITNSPRMGQCAYDGAMDHYAFDPNRLLSN